MVSTRSRVVRHANGSPFKSPPAVRHRRPRIATSLETGVCIHTDQETCSCATSRKPTDASLFSNGIQNSANNITEKFFLANLQIQARELDFLLCAGWFFKNCLTDAATSYGPTLVVKISDLNTWDIVDTASNTSHSLTMDVAIRMVDSLVLNDVDLTQITIDPYAAGPTNQAKWTVAPSSVIDLYEGVYDVTKYEGKQFTCTFLAPNFFRLLSLCPELKPLFNHVMTIPSPMRGYLFYLLLKAKISIKKQLEWKDLLRDRKLKQLESKDLQRDQELKRMSEKNRVMELHMQNMELSANTMNWTEQDIAKMQAMEEKINNIQETQQASQISIQEIAQTQRDDHTIVHNIREKQDLHDRKLQNIEEGQQASNDIVRQNAEKQQDDVQAIERDLTLHKAQLTSHEGKLTSHEGKLTSHEGKLTSHEGKLTSHEGQLEDIQEDNRSLLAEAVNAFTTSLDVKLATLAGHDNGPTPPESSMPRRPSHDIFLRLRNCTEHVEDSTTDLEGYKRVWTGGEGNRIISRAVTACLNQTTPFVIALMGYSGGGKSFTAFGPDGLLSGLLERYPPMFIEVTEVLDKRHSLGSYLSINQSAVAIAAAITKSRRSAETIANKDSSRSHLVLRFEDQVKGILSGILIDIAGPEQSENMVQLEHRMGKDSMKIGNDNIAIRKLLEAIGTGGDLKVLRHGCKLSTVVEAALGDAKAIALRVVLCGDGSSGDIAGKTMAMVPEFGM